MDFKNSKKNLILLSIIIFIVIALSTVFVFLIFTQNRSKISQTGSELISADSATTNEINDTTENISQDSKDEFKASIAENAILTVDEILLKLSVVEDDANVPNGTNSTTSTKSNSNKSSSNNKSDSTKVASSNGKPYYLKVNYTANVITVYKLDDEGNYTVPVKAMVCSTGTSTPRSGKYRLGSKYRWINLFGGVYGQYASQIVGNILFHSVPYKIKYDPSSLKYQEYDKLGTACSMGCIRLTVIDAKWIYDNVASGTYVEFYSDSNPGPLGKPGAKKISSNVDYRGWDPTDPDLNNPWKKTVTETPVTSQPEPTPAPTPVPATNTTSNTTKPDNTVENKISNTNTSKNNTVTNTNTNTNTSTGNTSKNNSTSTNNTNTNQNNNTSSSNTNTNKNTSTSNTNTTNNSNTSANTNSTKNNNTSTGNTNTSGNSVSNNTTNSTSNNNTTNHTTSNKNV